MAVTAGRGKKNNSSCQQSWPHSSQQMVTLAKSRADARPSRYPHPSMCPAAWQPYGSARSIHAATSFSGANGKWISQESQLENLPLRILKRKIGTSDSASQNLYCIWHSSVQRRRTEAKLT
ncbi:hypothetical protein O181_055818 [Austropuccinia psidii MF-1]|uniref:Uncharacterized protein n=1 Tax=Austropuccinia psidii MF-1 TaxID=1389203 RepID=A0A9Q3EBZ6_9BASI|nr:hypothetical protein [Austropuccinia psidii MF-1]